MPTRHLLTKLEKSTENIRRQIDRLVHVDIVNFFIAASPNEISGVLAEASDPQMLDGPYFSDEYAWYSMSMVGHCKRLTVMLGLFHIFSYAHLGTWSA